MNKKGWSLSGFSASAVSVLVAAFMIAGGYVWWGVGFIVLAIVLALISGKN
ncbi:MAG: hypothetical protein WC595_04805 [Candidatus Nanoarchaeia archaeon]